MVKNMIKNNILLFTLFVLIVIVIFSFTLVVFYDTYSRNKLSDEYFLVQNQLMLDDLYNTYLQESNSKELGCGVLTKQIDSLFVFQENLFTKLQKINKDGIVYSDNKLKFTYVLTNVRIWLYYNKLNTNCNMKQNVALFFYPEIRGNTSEEIQQDVKTMFFENQLKYYRDNCSLNVIALPYQKEIPIINQLILDYNIGNGPAIYYENKVYYDITKEESDFFKDIRCN